MSEHDAIKDLAAALTGLQRAMAGLHLASLRLEGALSVLAIEDREKLVASERIEELAECLLLLSARR